MHIWKCVTLEGKQCCFSSLACVNWKAECVMSSYCDFVKNSGRAVLIMNGWRAADCKHTRTVKWRRIASSFVFTQGHSERALGQGSMEQGERRKLQLGEIERAGHAFVVLFYSSSFLSPSGLICYWLARWSPAAPERQLQGYGSRWATTNEWKYICLQNPRRQILHGSAVLFQLHAVNNLHLLLYWIYFWGQKQAIQFSICSPHPATTPVLFLSSLCHLVDCMYIFHPATTLSLPSCLKTHTHIRMWVGVL